MGIDIYVLRFLADARQSGGPFESTLQIGRQGLYMSEQDHSLADSFLRDCGINNNYSDIVGTDYYSDKLLSKLGSTTIHAMDASDYEGAQIVHDLNDPIDESHHCTYDTILDGGSLEHIFNTPCAIGNLMSITKVGGRILSINGGNNFLGHGFYQFSPEWAFRVFSKENGFKIDKMYLVPLDGTANLNPVDDPAIVGRRIEIGYTPHSNYLMFSARKIEHVKPFSRWPQQSDYAAIWEQSQKKD